MKAIAIIPAYNEERTIRNVIVMVKKNVDQVIVINDGSADQTAKLAQEAGAEVYSHFLNRGLGAALATGFEVALKSGADIIVTFDADGQHRPEDISRLIKPILKNEAEVVIGSRFLSYRNFDKSKFRQPFNLRSKELDQIGKKSDMTQLFRRKGCPQEDSARAKRVPIREKRPMPLKRRIYNLIANLTTYLFFGTLVSDSQSGLRAFKRGALEKIKIKNDRMEVSSEIIREIKKNNLKLKEIPIEPIYTDYSLSKGQNFWVGVKTLFRLILGKII